MSRNTVVASILSLAALALGTSAQADDILRADLSRPDSAPVRNLLADWEDLDLETTATRGWYRGGFYAARFYGPRFYYYGYYGPRFYSSYYYGYYGSRYIYAPSYYVPIYTYSAFGYFPCADVITTPSRSVPLMPRVVEPAPAKPETTLPAPTPAPAKPAPATPAPAPGTFQYDGGPTQPIPMPGSTPDSSMGIPKRPEVYTDFVVSDPPMPRRSSGKWVYPAYGETPQRR